MKRITFFLKYYIFWVVLCIVSKGIFLLWNISESESLSGYDLWRVFLHGFRMDLSFAGYVAIVTSLVMVVGAFLKSGVTAVVMNVVTAILLVAYTVTFVVDMEIFANWGFHMDATPLGYLKTPGAAVASTTFGVAVALIAIMVAFFLCAWVVYRRFIKFPKGQVNCVKSALTFLVLGGLTVIPVRGGFNVAPMNIGFCYFHPTNMYANQAAVNGAWNFIYEVMHMGVKGKEWKFMEQHRAEGIVDSLCTSSPAFKKVVGVERPNVVVMLMESFTSNAIGVLGGYPDVTPELNKLAAEGVLFYNIYGTAQRSDRGLMGVISGQPSHPTTAIIKYPNKYKDKPCFSTLLKDVGYETSFYYAGDLNFGNFRSFTCTAFDRLVDENSFSGEAVKRRFKWGIHDEYTYEKIAQDMLNEKQPFCYMVFNLSSHEPFTIPTAHKFPGDVREDLFKSSIYYTDSCVGHFIRECKANGMWDNTLFVIVADHGTRSVGVSHDAQDPLSFKIPFLMTGGAMSVTDSVVYNIGSQVDVAKTMLAQLNIDVSNFVFSKNLLSDTLVQSAFFSNTTVAEFASERGVTVLDLKSSEWRGDNTSEEDRESLKAWLQVIDSELRDSL